MRRKIIATSIIAILSTAVWAETMRGPHNSGSFDKVIRKPTHEVGRTAAAIGFDDSTGEFNNGSESGSNAPSAPDVDLINPPKPPPPPPPPPPPKPTKVTINCGCAKVWFRNRGDAHPSGSCFSPKNARTQSSRNTGSHGLFNASYGSFWPNSSVSFYVTYNIKGTPYPESVEIRSSNYRKNVTSSIKNNGIWAIGKPDLNLASPQCSVTLINPARVYTKVNNQVNTGGNQRGEPVKCFSKDRSYYYVKSGNNGVNINNFWATGTGRYGSKRVSKDSCSGRGVGSKSESYIY
ncbi:hypothetical protein [Vibrio splendidus]|uniref:hypothetical protein n=5 Tax=Vibrio splendidus TaxID=29497 RepID=UPI003D0FEAFD